MTGITPAELEKTYDRRFGGTQEYRFRVWSVLIRDFFQALVPENGSVLDLGCGWGEFANQVRAARIFAMDLNPAAPRHLKPAVIFLHQNCAQPWALRDGELDTVFTSNFFEHLPSKEALAATLSEAYRCLRPGGRLICLGPNIKHLPGRYWDFWDHFLPLTELSLSEGLELAGFRIERAVDRFLPYTMVTGWRPPLWTVGVYLKVPLLWRLRGRQFLVIGVKP